jgi:hypothetical protein
MGSSSHLTAYVISNSYVISNNIVQMTSSASASPLASHLNRKRTSPSQTHSLPCLRGRQCEHVCCTSKPCSVCCHRTVSGAFAFLEALVRAAVCWPLQPHFLLPPPLDASTMFSPWQATTLAACSNTPHPNWVDRVGANSHVGLSNRDQFICRANYMGGQVIC